MPPETVRRALASASWHPRYGAGSMNRSGRLRIPVGRQIGPWRRDLPSTLPQGRPEGTSQNLIRLEHGSGDFRTGDVGV